MYVNKYNNRDVINKVSTPRQSNLELLRLLSMLFIVSNHYAFHGGSIYEGHNSQIACFFGNFSQVGVALFVMIGSWFLVDKKFSINRLFNLWKQVFFYSFGIAILVRTFSPSHCSLTQLIYSIFPVIFKRYWFIVPYIFLMFLHPFLNQFLATCDKWRIRVLCIILFILQSVIPSVFIVTDPFGYQISRFVFYYILVYALKRGYVTIYLSRTHLYFLIFLLGGAISCLFSIVMIYTNHVGKAFVWADNMASIPVVISAVFIFMGMIRLSFTSRVINLLAGSTFAVYLISEHPYLFSWIWIDVLNTSKYFYSPIIIYVVYSAVVILLVFFACIFIDMFLKHTLYRFMDIIRIPHSIADKIDNKMNL